MGSNGKWLVAAAAAWLAAPAFADGGKKSAFTVTPYLGGAHLKIDGEFLEEGVRRGEDLALVGVSLGVRLPVGLTLEVGRSDALHDDFSDWWQEGLSLTQRYAAVGWRISLGEAWYLTPKYGRAKWNLDADDENFVLPNGEIRDTINGYENFAEASLTKQLNDHFALGLTVRGIEAEFGESISGAVAVTWSF
jgi:hypothetical protein